MRNKKDRAQSGRPACNEVSVHNEHQRVQRETVCATRRIVHNQDDQSAMG